jgi:hypothetical protein
MLSRIWRPAAVLGQSIAAMNCQPPKHANRADAVPSSRQQRQRGLTPVSGDGDELTVARIDLLVRLLQGCAGTGEFVQAASMRSREPGHPVDEEVRHGLDQARPLDALGAVQPGGKPAITSA